MSAYPRDVSSIILDYLATIEVAFLMLYRYGTSLGHYLDKITNEVLQVYDYDWSRRYSENIDAILTCAIMSGSLQTFHETNIITYRNTEISLKLRNNHVSELNFILFMELHILWDLDQHIVALAECQMHLALNYVIFRGVKLDLEIVPLVVGPLLFIHNLPVDPTIIFNLLEWFLHHNDVNSVLHILCATKKDHYTVAEILIMRYPHFVLKYLQNDAYILSNSGSFNTAIGMLYRHELDLFQGYVNVVIALHSRNPNLKSDETIECIQHLIKYNHPYTHTLKQLLCILE